MTKAHEVLGIAEDATPEETRAAYKGLVQKHHPDKGGDTELFQQVVKAYKKLSKRPCSACEGTGKVRVRDGSFFQTMNCPACWQEE